MLLVMNIKAKIKVNMFLLVSDKKRYALKILVL